MVSDITLFKTRCDLRTSNQIGIFEREMQAVSENYSDNIINGICNSIISGTKHSISSKCAKYEMLEDNEVWSDSGKKLKKELSDDISLFKKLNEQNINAKINSLDLKIIGLEIKISDLKNEISGLKSDVKCYSIFKKLIELFPSISNFVCETANQIKVISEKYEVISEKCDELNNLYRSRKRINEKIEYVDKIEKRIIEKQSEALGVEIWKPKEITKESLINRIKSLKNLNHLIPLIKSSGFKEENFGESRKIILKGFLDLIVTSKSNYYLVDKRDSAIIGSGTSKVVYKGIDLSKNKPIAVAYVSDASKASKAFNEEITYLDLRENSKNEIIKIKDCLVSKDDGVCIFISDLYENGNMFHDLRIGNSKVRKNKNQFCKELIEIISLLCKKGIFLRDIKLDNFVIDGQLHPRLCDFDLNGFSHFTVAPEFLENHTYNEQACIWSLGAALYEIYCGEFIQDVFMLTGNPIDFREKSWANRIYYDLKDTLIDELFEAKIKKARLKDKPFLRIIREMLRKDPGARISTLADVNAQWEHAMKASSPPNH